MLTVAPIASATEYKIAGVWQHRPFSWADRNLAKGNHDDNMRASTRLRTWIEIIASESLKGVVYFQVGHQNWGYQSQGAALGTDGKFIGILESYVDWAIPDTEARMRVGLQGFALPSFTTIGNAISTDSTYAGGVVFSTPFTENIGSNLFWYRLENDNALTYDSETKKTFNPHDAMDFVGMTLPITFDGVRVTPWGMYGFVGRDSFQGTDFNLSIAQQGMMPLGATSSIISASDKAHGSAWYGGIAAQLSAFEPFNFALDAAYGSVDVGTSELNGRHFDVKRSGWYAVFLAEYKMDFGTPGILLWYTSGDDANPYNGSERLPSIFPDMYPTSYGFDGTNYGGAALTLGYGISGTWAAMARINNISFYEDLSHVLRLVYYQGTNNTQMVRDKFIANPQDTIGSMTYMTTADKAVEFNFDSTYKIYDNLTMHVELGYIRMDQDKELWRSVGYEANKNNFKYTLSFQYMF